MPRGSVTASHYKVIRSLEWGGDAAITPFRLAFLSPQLGFPISVAKVIPQYKDQARARFIEAASVVFRRKGFRATSMEDIAAEVGVSKGAIYRYFRTKAELLMQIQRRSRDAVVSEWSALVEKGDIAEGFAQSLDAVFSGEVDPGVWLELLAEAGDDQEVRRALVLDRREDTKLMRRFLESLEERGRIPKMRDAFATTQIVLSLFQATVMRLILEGNRGNARETLARELRAALGV
jgi:TetR/AcrR family transcriptional regulator, repressor for uid operon